MPPPMSPPASVGSLQQHQGSGPAGTKVGLE